MGGHAPGNSLASANKVGTISNSQRRHHRRCTIAHKTTEVGGPERGFDGGKNVKGRKRQRHLLVDTLGLPLKVKVLAANGAEQEGAKQLLSGINEQFPRLSHLWVDGGYRTTFVSWVKQQLGWSVERVRHPNAGSRRRITAPGVEPAPIDRSFKVIPRRWL